MNELTLLDSFFSDAIDNAFERTFPVFTDVYGCKSFSPVVDVKESNESYTLEMDLPGKSEKDVNIELDGNVLTISSVMEDVKEKKSSDETEVKSEEQPKEKWLIRERRYCNFKRSFTLPENVDKDAVTALFKNGVLTVRFSKIELPSPKKIAIEAA